ncbi:MAG: hypothetical protein ACYS5V_00460 [Planctomycetota bacterium]|jgi:hypothetical protein
MNATTIPHPARTATPPGGRGHFYVAAGVLAVAAAGFHLAVGWLGVVLVKKPVPPPEAADVDRHRLVNFPKHLGPYKLLGDGERFRDKEGNPIKDGKPDGIVEFRDEQVGEMDIPNHPLNWYYGGLFRDTRPGSGRVYQMNVTYYTGVLDAVPHVGEICIRAAGGQVLSADSGPMAVDAPRANAPWKRFKIKRVAYALYDEDGNPIRDRLGRPVKSAEYYVFSMNGNPTHDRLDVRRKLAWPLAKYCYYAKVQVAPLQPEPTLQKQDESCREFLRHAMPEVLRYLPSAKDVEALKRAGPADES